ncbi:MAG: peptidyl-prolyl cis-trans isomerase [Defluviitaleaceae bacterium]|nr:peptidyl-prolyl cis-trans isomerase [Defluviitaleaceae bacterium]
MKKFFTICAVLAIFTLTMFTLTACGGNAASLEAMVLEGTVVATVNGLDVTAGEVAIMIEEASWNLQWDFERDIDEENFDRVMLEDAARLAAFWVILGDFAARNNITLSQDEIDLVSQNIAFMAAEHGDDFDDFLAEHHVYDIAQLERYFYNLSLANASIEAIVASSELFAEFEHLMEPEFTNEIIGVQHILIDLDDFDDADAAMTFAQGLRARAVAGEDFKALMAAYGNDPGMERDPDGYFFTMGAFNNPTFENEAYILAINEVGQPFFAMHGIHIIRRVSPDTNPDPTNIMFGPPPPTEEERRMMAVFRGFDEKSENAEIVFLPALYDMVTDDANDGGTGRRQ